MSIFSAASPRSSNVGEELIEFVGIVDPGAEGFAKAVAGHYGGLHDDRQTRSVRQARGFGQFNGFAMNSAFEDGGVDVHAGIVGIPAAVRQEKSRDHHPRSGR